MMLKLCELDKGKLRSAEVASTNKEVMFASSPNTCVLMHNVAKPIDKRDLMIVMMNVMLIDDDAQNE